jgi:Hint module
LYRCPYLPRRQSILTSEANETATAATTGAATTEAVTSTTADSFTVPVVDTVITTATDKNPSDSCFPAAATVQLQNGSVARMDALSIGDMVKVSSDDFSPVFMFTHKLIDTVNNFVVLSTSSGEILTVTPGHFIYINDALSAASEAAVGSTLRLGTGGSTIITSVAATISTGLFNPQTAHGDIVVDGIVASTYTTAVDPSVAHILLAPLRAVYAFTGIRMTAFESGASSFVGIAPRGMVIAL